MKKKTIASVASIITAAFVVFGGYLYQDGNKTPVNDKSSTYSSIQTLEKVEFPDSIIDVAGEGIEPFGYINATVTKVTDGDTFHAEYKDKEYKVRMLDIDTPESVKSGVDPQPFSGEASDLTKDTLTNKTVKLIFEEDTTDQYGRLLAHVVLEDGSFYNAMMVNEGYAISVFYSPNTHLKSFYDKLQNDAITEGKGFWELPESKRPYTKNQKGKYVASYKNSK
ncbi:thermonuclease family protein [Clostridium sp. BNL1100]|uniref:thermonuclease family protein n=1 Tax=Clostridium sp. BNL1100 TaxID=755731 RepID=UPI00024A779C|nr:thermonuclease family protein [Clostridium sp. BNL1100]AEY64791.1 micrococcal nuclease-like nuclease [Clostridium sp. BNL1100]